MRLLILLGCPVILYLLPITRAAKLTILVFVLFAYRSMDLADRFQELINRITALEKRQRPRGVRLTSYRLEVVVNPDWDAIVNHIAERYPEAGDAIISIRSREGPINPAGLGLFGRGFSFIVFKDAVSGMEFIWSDHDHGFVERMVVEGKIFEKLKPGGPEPIANCLIASPTRIGFRHPWDPGGDTPSDLVDNELATIPYDEIVRFLFDLESHYSQVSMLAVRRFPKEIQKLLDDSETMYVLDAYSLRHLGAEFNREPNDTINSLDWIKKQGIEFYNQDMVYQEFQNAFQRVSLRLETYESTRLATLSEDEDE